MPFVKLEWHLIFEREYYTTVSAANTDPSVSCARPVCACLLWCSRSGTQSGTQAEAGLNKRDATRLQAETQDCCWHLILGTLRHFAALSLALGYSWPSSYVADSQLQLTTTKGKAGSALYVVVTRKSVPSDLYRKSISSVL
jgi:hypothetical protein